MMYRVLDTHIDIDASPVHIWKVLFNFLRGKIGTDSIIGKPVLETCLALLYLLAVLS